MKEYAEKVALLIVPLLLVVSICYNNGYWSLYSINVYDYYQVTDILKDIAIPSFRFISIAFIPIITAIAISISFLQNLETVTVGNRKKRKASEPKAASNNNQLTTKSRKKFKDFLKEIGVAVVAITLLLILTSVAIFLSLILSSYSDDIDLAIIYFKSFQTLELDALGICFGVPLFSSLAIIAAAKNKPGKEDDNIIKLTTFLSCILFTLFLAYHAGRFDAWKIALGYDFYFKLDKKKIPQKYLGKLDKYYIFAYDDKMFVNNGREFTFRLDTLAYSPQLSIIHEDSLKMLRMIHYHSSKLLNPTRLYGNFTLITPDSIFSNNKFNYNQKQPDIKKPHR